jgi:hypothetical protein
MGIRLDADLKTTVLVMQPAQKQQYLLCSQHKNNSACYAASTKTAVPVMQPVQKQIQKQQIHKKKTLEQTKQKPMTGKSNMKEVLGQNP